MAETTILVVGKGDLLWSHFGIPFFSEILKISFRQPLGLTETTRFFRGKIKDPMRMMKNVLSVEKRSPIHIEFPKKRRLAERFTYQVPAGSTSFFKLRPPPVRALSNPNVRLLMGHRGTCELAAVLSVLTPEAVEGINVLGQGRHQDGAEKLIVPQKNGETWGP